ncbi:FeoA family protein [Actinomycetota bacterium]
MTLTLDRAPIGEPLVFLEASTAPEVRRRLAELGLRRGAHLTCVQRTSGRGRVVSVAGSRIAIDAATLGHLTVQPLSAIEELVREGA